jgi:4-hydroxybenzoate polyprenyltransferase
MTGGYRSATILLALATVGLGIVMFVIGAIHGGTTGLVLGVLFIAAGIGRLWMIKKRYG